MTLIDRLLRIADLWAEAKGHSSTSRLSTIVANDGGLLKRLAEGGNLTVATVDKFVCFLRDSTNWPDAVLPAEASELIDQIGHITSLPEADAA